MALDVVRSKLVIGPQIFLSFVDWFGFILLSISFNAAQLLCWVPLIFFSRYPSFRQLLTVRIPGDSSSDFFSNGIALFLWILLDPHWIPSILLDDFFLIVFLDFFSVICAFFFPLLCSSDVPLLLIPRFMSWFLLFCGIHFHIFGVVLVWFGFTFYLYI